MWTDSVVKRSNQLPDVGTTHTQFYSLWLLILACEQGFNITDSDEFVLTPFFGPPGGATTAFEMGMYYASAPLSFVVEAKNSTVLLVEIKSATGLKDGHQRKEADLQMRKRFHQFWEQVKVPRIYGISAFGRRMSVYWVDMATSEIHSHPIAEEEENPKILVDVAPKRRWDLDVMEEEGFKRFAEIVADIKDMVSKLQPDAPGYTWSVESSNDSRCTCSNHPSFTA